MRRFGSAIVLYVFYLGGRLSPGANSGTDCSGDSQDGRWKYISVMFSDMNRYFTGRFVCVFQRNSAKSLATI